MSIGTGLDFASERKRNSPRSFALCIVLGIIVAAMFLRLASLDRSLQITQQKRAEIDAKAADAAATTETPKSENLDPQKVTAVNTAIAQLNVPWEAALRAIETRRPMHVSLLKIEPYPSDRRLRLTAEAQDADALFSFVSKLSEDQAFVSVLPVRQEKVEPEGRPALNLTIELEWRL